jgi:hypothetical protein
MPSWCAAVGPDQYILPTGTDGNDHQIDNHKYYHGSHGFGLHGPLVIY